MDKNFLSELGIDTDTADTIITKYSDEINNIQLNFALEKELTKRGVKSIDAAIKLFDKNNPEYSNLTIDNISEKIDDFELKYDFLFGNTNPKPHFSQHSARSTGITKAEFEKMGYEKRLKLFNESPDVYKKLTKN